MIRVSFRTDDFYRFLTKLEKDTPSREAMKPIGVYLIEDIRQNWSSASPSSPFNPPAIDTGNFDDTLASEIPRQNRQQNGRFAKGFTVRIHTGTEKSYAQALETGTRYMEARPYFEPALRRLPLRFKGVSVDES